MLSSISGPANLWAQIEARRAAQSGQNSAAGASTGGGTSAGGTTTGTTTGTTPAMTSDTWSTLLTSGSAGSPRTHGAAAGTGSQAVHHAGHAHHGHRAQDIGSSAADGTEETGAAEASGDTDEVGTPSTTGGGDAFSALMQELQSVASNLGSQAGGIAAGSNPIDLLASGLQTIAADLQNLPGAGAGGVPMQAGGTSGAGGSVNSAGTLSSTGSLEAWGGSGMPHMAQALAAYASQSAMLGASGGSSAIA